MGARASIDDVIEECRTFFYGGFESYHWYSYKDINAYTVPIYRTISMMLEKTGPLIDHEVHSALSNILHKPISGSNPDWKPPIYQLEQYLLNSSEHYCEPYGIKLISLPEAVFYNETRGPIRWVSVKPPKVFYKEPVDLQEFGARYIEKYDGSEQMLLTGIFKKIPEGGFRSFHGIYDITVPEIAKAVARMVKANDPMRLVDISYGIMPVLQDIGFKRTCAGISSIIQKNKDLLKGIHWISIGDAVRKYHPKLGKAMAPSTHILYVDEKKLAKYARTYQKTFRW
jgi:hypothetical protein